MVCAQCHSFRDIYVNGFAAGSDYYDFFLPVLEFNQPVNRDPAYWPDGMKEAGWNSGFCEAPNSATGCKLRMAFVLMPLAE